MTISMYSASVPSFVAMLNALDAVLAKAAAHAEAKNIDPSVLLGSRLFPDMFPLSRQVQIACDFAKGTTARLAGMEVPVYEDNEKTFADLRVRIAKTLAFVTSLKPGQIDGSEERQVTLKVGGESMTFKGEPYLVGFALPNFYFHLTAAYAILRHNGVELGKRDYLGALPA